MYSELLQNSWKKKPGFRKDLENRSPRKTRLNLTRIPRFFSQRLPNSVQPRSAFSNDYSPRIKSADTFDTFEENRPRNPVRCQARSRTSYRHPPRRWWTTRVNLRASRISSSFSLFLSFSLSLSRMEAIGNSSSAAPPVLLDASLIVPRRARARNVSRPIKGEHRFNRRFSSQPRRLSRRRAT